MQHDINPGNIQWVVTRLNDAIGNGQFSSGEVLIGAAEFLGRLIVGITESPVAGMQAAQEMENHIKRTMLSGYTARGFNMGSE